MMRAKEGDKLRKMKDSGVEWIGEIPADWEIGRIKYNYYLKGRIGWQGLKANEFIEEGPYLVTGTDFVKGRVNWNSCYHISLERFDEAPEIHIDIDDLLITKDGTVGKVAYIESKPEKASLNSHLLLMRPLKKEYANRFLFWVIQSEVFEKYVGLSQNGTIMASLSQEKINDFSFPLPSIKEQYRIADYLDEKCAKIDAIIEKQQAVIEKLKAYKLSVITEAVTMGLNPNAEMRDSGIDWIGEIPAHWNVTTVSKNATVVRGASPRPAGDPKYFNGQDVPWITVAEVTNGEGKYIYSTEAFLTNEGAKHSRIVEAGTLLLSNSGATLGVPKVTKITGCINDGSVAFVDLKIDQMYLLYVFKSRTYELRKQMAGYGQPNLNTTIVKNIYIPLPPGCEQKKICLSLDKKCSGIDKTIEAKQTLIGKLTEFKKSLIYEVVTGKREV